MEREPKYLMSEECEKFLKDKWEDKLRDVKDIKKFIREEVNPFSREIRKKGKLWPIVQIGRRQGTLYLKLSDER